MAAMPREAPAGSAAFPGASARAGIARMARSYAEMHVLDICQPK